MTGNCRPEAEQLVASAEGAEEATSNPERGEGGCHPARRFELSVGTAGSGGNTVTDLEKAVKFAQCAHDNGVKGFPDPTSDGPLVDTSRIPSAAGRGARSISGFQAAADKLHRHRLSASWGCGSSDAEDLGAGRSGRPGCRYRHRRHGRHVQWEASDLCRTGAAAEHGEGGKAGALSAMVSVDGTLTYQAQSDGSPYSVINQASGTYTELPVPGQVISQGQVLYRVNDSPVVLLYGSTPAYRTLSAGATGADVAELNADLVALGYATAAQLSATSSFFGSATATAVEKLQAALGSDPERHASLGQAVFEPTAVRVTTLSAQLGGNTQSRPDGDAGHLDHSPGAGGVGRLATDPTWRSGTR